MFIIATFFLYDSPFFLFVYEAAADKQKFDLA